jgi:hypothetical protein
LSKFLCFGESSAVANRVLQTYKNKSLAQSPPLLVQSNPALIRLDIIFMHKPPIDIKALTKAGAFDEDKFYQELSEQMGYVSKEQAQRFYMALVRTATKRLREKGVIKFPHLGIFALVWQGDRWGLMGKTMGRIPGCYMIRFYITESWKNYWTKFKEGAVGGGSLDPRAKVLNRKEL